MSATSGEGGSPDTQRSLAACLVRPLASPISPQAPNTHDPAKAKARLCIAAHTRASIPMSVATLPVRIQRNTATCRRHTTTARLRPATVGRNLPLLSAIQLRLAACRGHTPHHGKSLLRTKLLVRPSVKSPPVADCPNNRVSMSRASTYIVGSRYQRDHPCAARQASRRREPMGR